MRIVQLIDSLDIGGAEKMAVNYANALVDKISFSGLITTRKEGALKNQLSSDVNYLFLNRKRFLDINAILKGVHYCKKHKITHLQPHSSSFFTGILIKMILPKIKIIWHDHNGLSEFLSNRKSFALKIASFFFKGIVVVNHQLKKWAENELNCRNIIYLANFTSIQTTNKSETQLKGTPGKRILCLANLRLQKNHFFLIKVAEKVSLNYPEWSFHCVGNDFLDDYSSKVYNEIKSNGLTNIHFYGSRNDIPNILKQCEIGILTSSSEGLPVSLIEYGMARLAVVSTDVGEIPNIIKNNINGATSPSNDPNKFYIELSKYINDKDLRVLHSNRLNNDVMKNFSKESVISDYLDWIERIN